MSSKQTGRLMECLAIHIADLPGIFLDAAAGDVDARRIATLVKKYLTDARETATPCMSCNTVFHGEARPVALALILPAEGGGVAFTAGICRECDGSDDELTHRAVSQLSKEFPGDITVLPAEGHA
jgi:hypothetical protein